jgi:hypothetical protein
MTTITSAYALCHELERRRVGYELHMVRPEALMVSVAVPGERWELEFFDDGRIEVERFQSLGVETDPGGPEKLLNFFEDLSSE